MSDFICKLYKKSILVNCVVLLLHGCPASTPEVAVPPWNGISWHYDASTNYLELEMTADASSLHSSGLQQTSGGVARQGNSIYVSLRALMCSYCRASEPLVQFQILGITPGSYQVFDTSQNSLIGVIDTKLKEGHIP